MVTKIYLPAMREPVINGVRLGLGVAIIGTLLAETKLSNRGIGFLIIQAYSTLRHAAHVCAADPRCSRWRSAPTRWSAGWPRQRQPTRSEPRPERGGNDMNRIAS